jgi:hypothetical protein
LVRNMEFLDVSSLLGQGFFADRVVRILCKTGPINASEESALKRVRTFLDKILEGQKQVRAEKLSCNAVETIDAYQKALVIFSQAILQESEEMTAARFQEFMDRMSAEVEKILKNKRVTPEAKTTLEFFKYIQRQTVNETSEYMSKRAVLKWPTPATFYKF